MGGRGSPERRVLNRNSPVQPALPEGRKAELVENSAQTAKFDELPCAIGTSLRNCYRIPFSANAYRIHLLERFALFRLLLLFFGTLTPDLRACESPMAMACFLLLTALPERPLLSVPRLRSCIAFLTLSPAFLLYRAIFSLLSVNLKVLK
jgi:hypothetical protein